MDDSAITAAFVALAMGMFKLIEKMVAKANGGGVEYRLAQVEKELADMKLKLHTFQLAFYQFREETRIRWAKQEGQDD